MTETTDEVETDAAETIRELQASLMLQSKANVDLAMENERLRAAVKAGVELVAHLQGITDRYAIDDTIAFALGMHRD